MSVKIAPMQNYVTMNDWISLSKIAIFVKIAPMKHFVTRHGWFPTLVSYYFHNRYFFRLDRPHAKVCNHEWLFFASTITIFVKDRPMQNRVTKHVLFLPLQLSSSLRSTSYIFLQPKAYLRFSLFLFFATICSCSPICLEVYYRVLLDRCLSIDYSLPLYNAWLGFFFQNFHFR